jgi:glycosyltransferase involved in cell wall biosynthesis
MCSNISGEKEMEKIIALIPSYNEARAIGGIAGQLKSMGLSVCVIDDGSADDTSGIARQAGAFVIRHEKNRGKGASLIDGFGYAVKEGFSAALVLDGDGQHLVDDAGRFFKKMEETGADIVIGNRMSDTSIMPASRKLTNKFMSYLISKICGHDIPDTQCGFRLIRSRVLEGVHLKSSNYEIESELLLKAARKGFKIESVPVKTVYENEKSRINPFVDTVRFIIFLIKTMAGR